VTFTLIALALSGAIFLAVQIGLPGGVLLIQVLATFLGLLDVTLSPWLVLSTMLFVVAVATVASAGPALVASRMNIRSILHYE
jgi:ABC-type antimicrobial peptide transport system permease subunit